MNENEPIEYIEEPRVLLATPISVYKEYCIYEWLVSLTKLTYPVDVFLVDNSPNAKFSNKIRKLGFDVLHVPQKKREARDFMAECNEIIRKKAVDEGYDYLFILECDIFAPPNVVERLMFHNLPVVGATYFTNWGENTLLQLLKVEEFYQTYITKYMGLAEGIKFCDGRIKQAFANGNGCILIHIEVLKQITFRVDNTTIGYADAFFHRDLFELGIPNWVDTSLIVNHKNSNWGAIPEHIKHSLTKLQQNGK